MPFIFFTLCRQTREQDSPFLQLLQSEMVKTHRHSTNYLQLWTCRSESHILENHRYKYVTLFIACRIFKQAKDNPPTCSVQQFCINLLSQDAEQSINTLDLLKQLLPRHWDVIRVPQFKLHPGRKVWLRIKFLLIFCSFTEGNAFVCAQYRWFFKLLKLPLRYTQSKTIYWALFLWFSETFLHLHCGTIPLPVFLNKQKQSCLLRVNDEQSGDSNYNLHHSYIRYNRHSSVSLLCRKISEFKWVQDNTHCPDSRRIFRPSGGICRVTYTRGRVDMSLWMLLVWPPVIFSGETAILWSRRSATRLHHIARKE